MEFNPPDYYGITRSSVEDYAEDIASKIVLHKFKEAARLSVNFQKFYGNELYQDMLQRILNKGVSQYLLNKMLDQIHKMKKWGEK